MVIKYQIKFKSQTVNDDYRELAVNIYDAAYSGTPIQLTGAATPFATDETSDDYYEPTVNNSGNIRFICTDESQLADMLPTKATDRPVTLTDAAGDVLWAGFVSGEQYSQPWRPVPYEVTLPVKGILSMMDGVAFTQDDGFTSLQTLADTISTYLPYTVKIFAPSTIPFASVLVSNDNFREYLTPKERKNQDTTNIYSANSIGDVFETFCNYFGVSCHEWHGNLYLVAHDAAGYLDAAGTSLTPTTSALLRKWIMAANNKAGFTKMYRYVHGEFNTGSDGDSDSNVLCLSDFSEYMKTIGSKGQFVIFDAAGPVTNYMPTTETPRTVTDDNDTCYLAPKSLCGILYRNGNAYQSSKETIGVISHYYDDTGRHDLLGWGSSSGNDIMQVTTPAADNEIKKVFTIKSQRPIKITSGEHSLLSIAMEIKCFGVKFASSISGGAVFMDGKLKKGDIYMSFKVGDYYLSLTQIEKTDSSGNRIKTTAAIWTTEESYVPVKVLNDRPRMNVLYDDDDAKTAIFTSSPNILISLPDNLRNKLQYVEVGFYSGIHHLFKYSTSDTTDSVFTKDDGKDFKVNYAYIVISNFKVGLAYESGTEAIGMDFDSNKYIVPNDNASTYKYDVTSDITTRVGVQHGTGLALNSDYSYCTTYYDKTGCERRAAFVKASRKTVNVAVDNNLDFAPYDRLMWGGKTFGILGQSVDWRANINKLKLINID